MTHNDILVNLAQLNNKQLRQVQAQVAFLLKQREEPQKPKSFLIDPLCLYAKNWVTVPPKVVLEKYDPKGVGTKLADAASEIENLAQMMNLNKRETLELCKLVIEAGVFRLRDISIPVSFTTLVGIIIDPGDVLDQEFPGYLKSGLFKQFVLNSRLVTK